MLAKLTLPTIVLIGAAQMASAETWLLAAAACPPWKDIPEEPDLSQKMSQACANDVNLITAGLQAAFDLPDSNVTQLVNAQATAPGVSQAILALADKVGPEDQVFIYVNTHGGQMDALYKGYPAHDEVLAWYTEERPDDYTRATQDGEWMSARTLRDLVNTVVAEEIVVIIEACHAAAALDDFINNVHDGVGGRGEDWPGREAVIFSSHAEQVANFTQEGDEALFTKVLSERLSSGHYALFGDLYEDARRITHRRVRENCAVDHTHKELVQGWEDYKLLCTQSPRVWDPFGLLDDLKIPKTAFGTTNY